MFGDYETEEEYLQSLKQDDSYHFSMEFEYIEKNYGNGQYDIGTATMEVDVNWDDSQNGYAVSYYCPDISNIDPAEGNIDEIYTHIESDVLDELGELGIGPEAMIGGTGH